MYISCWKSAAATTTTTSNSTTTATTKAKAQQEAPRPRQGPRKREHTTKMTTNNKSGYWSPSFPLTQWEFLALLPVPQRRMDLREPVLIAKVVGRVMHHQDQVLVILLCQLYLAVRDWGHLRKSFCTLAGCSIGSCQEMEDAKNG